MGCLKDSTVSLEREAEDEEMMHAAELAHPEWSFDQCWHWVECVRREERMRVEARKMNEERQPRLW